MSYLLSGEIFDNRRGTDAAKFDRVSVIGRLECHKEMHSKNAHYTTKQYSTKGKRDIMVIMSSTIVCYPKKEIPSKLWEPPFFIVTYLKE
jgi:hypothetical protein